MRLFLASKIKDNRTIKKLEEYIGGFKGKNVALIPTASNGEDGWESWKIKESGTWNFIHSTDAKVEDIILEDFRNDSVIKKLEGKDIIWVMGGMAGYLSYWIRRCGIDRHITRLLNSGTLYVGSSAGAMVAGQTLQISNWKSMDGERGAEGIKPMGLVDFDIFPHFLDEYLPEIKKRYTGNKIYLLKDGEEIMVEDGKVTVIGEERIITNL